MMFKNSFKLFCANFDKVWKYLVYQILVWGIIFALLAPFYNTISSAIVSAWSDFGIKQYFVNGTFYGINLVSAFTNIVNAIINVFATMFSGNLICAIYVLVILFYVRPVLTNIGKFALQETIYHQMSSLSKTSFTVNILRTLKKSLPLVCVKALYTLPFDAMILAALYAITRVTAPDFIYALPFVIVIVPAILLAFKQVFVMGWIPARIVFDENLCSSYRKGMSVVLRRGLKIFSTAFVIFLLMLILAMVLGLYSLIVILPCITPLLSVFEMVAFFSSQGMRFYVDGDTIISPKRLEEVDSIEKAKYLL